MALLYTYHWSNGVNTQTISNLAPGSYSVTVTDSNGCTKTGSATVANGSVPVNATISGSTSVCQGQTISLTASGGSTYLWNTGATASTVTVGGSTYIVTVTNTSGCTATATKTVVVNPSPTGLSLLPITVTATGTYPVTITNASGCTAATTIPVTVNCTPLPPVHDTVTVTNTVLFLCRCRLIPVLVGMRWMRTP